ncbi:MAG TPA: 4-alpha-glucanotransferase [Polyangiaceae bacterium]|nr:4-alpha-glucanotransferase [Polyangiaceae bacterium]
MHTSPFDRRSSGILLHPSSLPGPHGIGDLGPSAHAFAEFLARAGQRWWQMLPVGPLGGGESPYDSPSSFAGNPLLISLDMLAQDGLLQPSDVVAPARLVNAKTCLFQTARRFKLKRLRHAFERYSERRHEFAEDMASFRARNASWLEGYAAFAALKRAHGGRHWQHFGPEFSHYSPGLVERMSPELRREVECEEFVQFVFDRQWRKLRAHCHHLGIQLLGDVPMFVSHDGADVWQTREAFQLDHAGNRRVVAGVPPDYFSADGQLWGNPLYDWDALRRTDFGWWVSRMATTLSRFDAVRLDHFIGFVRYWEIPAGAHSAREGHFVPAPGVALFNRFREAFGSLPFLAEDLGIVTDEVHALRDQFGLPGMKVLEFAFGGGRDYQPHRFDPRTVVYTGTHDNDTLMGWLTAYERCEEPKERERLLAERNRALAYVGATDQEPNFAFIRAAMASVANTAIFPLQDLLGQGTWARMNVPGTSSGNWCYRCSREDLSIPVAQRLAALTETYERLVR